MVNIEVNVDAVQNDPTPARERSIFALGWVHFKSSSNSKSGSADDEMRVLGMMVVKDAVGTQPTKKEGAY